MSILDCAKGKVPPTLYRQLETRYNELRQQFDIDTANTMLVQEFDTTLKDRQRAQLKQAIINVDVEKQISDILEMQQAEYNEMKFGKLFKPEPSRTTAAVELYIRADRSAQQEVIDALGQLVEFEDKIAASGLRMRHNAELMKEVSTGLIDGEEAVSAAARPIVNEVRTVLNTVLTKYRAVGGAIGEVKNYFPIRHDRAKVANVSFEEWYADYRAMNDISQMRDYRTRGPMTEDRFRELAQDAYENIVTDGMVRFEKQAGRKRKAGDMFNRRGHSRLSVPESAEAFHKYNQKYGVGDEGLYDMLLANVRDMAHDVGIMRELGPMPNNLNDSIKLNARASAAQQSKLDGYFRTLIGHWDGDNSDSLLAQSTIGLQNLMSSALLGTASVAALGDQIFVNNAARMAGLVGYDKGLKAFFDGINPATDKNEIVRMVRIAEALQMASVSRFSHGADISVAGKLNTGLNTAKLLNHRISGLNSLTLAAGDQMTLMLTASLSEAIGKGVPWGELNDNFRKVLQRNRVGESDWQRLLTQPLDDNGMVSIRALPDELEDIRFNLNNLDLELRAWATNSPTLTTRVWSSGNVLGPRVRGDLGHLFMSSSMQLKSFPSMVLLNHFFPAMRRLAQGDAAPLTILSMQGLFFGALIVQGKEMLKNNPTYEWDDPQLYAKAFIQAGTAGLIGDMIMRDPEQYGRNLIAELVGGPTANITTDLAMKSMAQIKRSLDEEPDNVNWSAVRRGMLRTVPFSSLFYARGAYERIIIDGLDRSLDPNFYDRVKRRNNRMLEERGALPLFQPE